MAVSITEEKQNIVDNILKAVFLSGFVLNIVVVIRDLEAGISLGNALTNSMFVLLVGVILLFGKRVQTHTKAWILLALFLFLGVKLLFVSGISGGTFHFFIIGSIIALLIIKRQTALRYILAAGIAYFLVLTLVVTDVIKPAVDNEAISIHVRYFGELFSYVFMLFIVIGAIGRLQLSFTESIQELDESNQKLNQYNEELLNQIEQIREMENKVAQTEINFRKVFEESNDGIIVCDHEGSIVECNQTISRMLEFPKTYLIGNRASDFVSPEDKRIIDQVDIEKIHRSRVREMHLISKSGGRIPVEVNYSVIMLNDRKAILVTVRDIRERKETEQKILNAVIQAEENERSRFAKDLHDDLGPMLSSIKMYIQSLRTHVDSESKKELVSRLIGTVDDSIKSIRRISHNLSSHLLQNMGLVNALETHADRINMANSIKIEFRHNFADNQRLPSNIEIVVYRVVLELITNSIRHSKGTIIEIQLELSNGQLQISYCDNGTGFDVDATLQDSSRGIGLKNIVSRVRSVNGLLTFDTARHGFNTRIEVKI